MSEQYWVLRVQGRNRWQETVYTGAPGGAFQEALNLAEKYQAEVTVFEAKPVRVVSIKDVSEKPEAPAPYEIVNGATVYRPCGHRVEAGDGELIPNYCPVCAGKRRPWWERAPWKELVVWVRDRGAFYFRACGHLVPMDKEEIPACCPTCAKENIKPYSAEAAAPGGTGGQARAEAGPGPGRG